MEGILQVASATFINIDTVVPALIMGLGGPNSLVGLTRGFATFILQMPQIIAAPYIERLPLKKGFVLRSRLVYTIALLASGLAIGLLTKINGTLGLVVFLITLFISWFAWGLGDPAWVDLMAKINPSDKLGDFFTTRFFLGNIAGIFASYAMGSILSLDIHPYNYALVYIISFILAGSANYVFTLTQEDKEPVTEKTGSLLSYLKKIPNTLHEDPNFSLFLVANLMYILATMSIPLFVVYGFRRFSLPQSFTGVATILIITGQLIGAFLLRFVSKKFGHKIGLVMGITSIFTANLIAVFAEVPTLYYAVFFLVGLTLCSNNTSKFAFLVNIAPLDQRPSYLAYINACGSPFVLISPFLGGILADKLGYTAPFLTALLSASICLYLLVFKVTEKRKVEGIIV